MMRLSTFIIVVLLFANACSNGLTGVSENKINTAERFYNVMADGMGDKAYEMLNHGVYDEKWRNTVRGNASTIERFVKKYGKANKSKWYIEYDTTYTLYKVERIVIPLYKGNDKSYQFRELNLKIGFDITNQYLPDTVIADYDLERIYD